MITSIVKTFYYLKWCPIFEGSALCFFMKDNNFLLKCWVLAKNLAYFVSLPVKLVTHISIPPNHLSILFRHSKFPFNFRQIWHTSQLSPTSKILQCVLWKTYISHKVWGYIHCVWSYFLSNQYLTNVEYWLEEPNHTSKTKVYFNEFVANVLRDNIW